MTDTAWRDEIPPERHFKFDVAEALQAAHDNLASCPEQCWDGDADSWDWNHHAAALLATPQMQAIRSALLLLNAIGDAMCEDTLADLPQAVIAWVLDNEANR